MNVPFELGVNDQIVMNGRTFSVESIDDGEAVMSKWRNDPVDVDVRLETYTSDEIARMMSVAGKIEIVRSEHGDR